MNGHSTEHRQLRASTVSAARTASPESSVRRSTRRRRGPASSEAIDLTSTQASLNPTGPPPAKRARTNTSQTSHRGLSATPLISAASSDQKPLPWLLEKIEKGIEEIDLTDADSDDKLLAKAQEDLLKMQKADGQEKPKLADFKCVICLDDPIDLASTPCGHIFCRFCLEGALKAAPLPGTKNGRCPVCRRKVGIKDIVSLEIKVLSRMKDKGKGKDRAS